MEKYGFVYIWRDRKHKRFYIGSHWGTETDGYICSSRWMRKAYRRRPDDFKRRVVSRIYSDRVTLFLEEERWIGMIQKEEIGKRYYNLKFGSQNHWVTTGSKVSVGEKISKGQKKFYAEHPEVRDEIVRSKKKYWDLPESREAAREKTLKYFEEHPEARAVAREKSRQSAKTVGLRGVHWEGARRTWRSNLTLNRKVIYLGRFDDPILAGLTYDAAAKIAWGLSCLNFSPEKSDHIVLSDRVLSKLLPSYSE